MDKGKAIESALLQIEKMNALVEPKRYESSARGDDLLGEQVPRLAQEGDAHGCLCDRDPSAGFPGAGGRRATPTLASGDDAEGRLKAMCEKLLANTVIEDYRVELLG